MHPVLFQFGGLTIYSFGVMVAIAFMVAAQWIARRAADRGWVADKAVMIAIWLLAAGLVGAKLWYALYFPAEFLADPVGMLFSQGGLVWYGGLIAACLAAVALSRWESFSIWQLGDIMMPPLALGMAIGRIGCLLAGCCYGAPCDLSAIPWAIQYPAGHDTFPAHVHPAPLYESLAMVMIIPMLLYADRHRKADGTTMALFFVLYGIERFIVEYFRGDRLVWMQSLNLSASQVISIGMIVLGLGLLAWRSRKPSLKQQQPPACC
ncbi:MAG: prolipoprotein diacylglyceryl transferase [Candidatus Melainabacteria bacterium]